MTVLIWQELLKISDIKLSIFLKLNKIIKIEKVIFLLCFLGNFRIINEKENLLVASR